MPLTHAFIDQEIQRIKNLEDVSEEEKAYRIETWQKMKANAVADGNPPVYRRRKSKPSRRKFL